MRLRRSFKGFTMPGSISHLSLKFSDREMLAVDQAQVQRLEALQELTNRVPLEEVAALLGMTARQLKDELRLDRTIE